MLKPCRRCKNEYEAKDYQVRRGDYMCPPCMTSYNAELRERQIQEGRYKPRVQKPREWHRAYEAAYFKVEENRLRRNALMREYSKAHGTAEHHKARRKVRHEIQMGRLVRQPCEVCGESKVHAHHDDYNKPLDIRWLCLKHHQEHHAKHGEHK